MKAVEAKLRRFGYQRIGAMLECTGMILKPQEAVSALHGGEAGRQATTRPETGARIADANEQFEGSAPGALAQPETDKVLSKIFRTFCHATTAPWV
jgi:hypothetical protein